MFLVAHQLIMFMINVARVDPEGMENSVGSEVLNSQKSTQVTLLTLLISCY